MVHLTGIPDKPLNGGSDTASNGRLTPNPDGRRTPQLQLSNFADEFTTSVYGSRFAGQDLPRNKMPECEMPRDIAYRMIKDDLSLDNNPKLKYVHTQFN